MRVRTLASADRRAARVRAVLAGFMKDLGSTAPGPARVHRLRVTIKKLRGWIRLLRFAHERRMGIGVDRALRSLAHSVAANRDRHVMAQTVGLLRAELRDGRDSRALTSLRRRIQRPAPAAAPIMFPAAMLAALQRLCAQQPDAADLLRGFDRSYRRTRRLGARAVLRDAAPALRHAWRRRVKYLYYQSRFICGDDKTAWQRGLDRLGAVLGEMHDLDLLEAQLRELPATETETAQRLVVRAAKRRGAQVGRLYRRCFAKKHARLHA